MAKLSNKKMLIRRMTVLGILIAILAVFQFVPMIGYIPTPWGAAITIMPTIALLIIIVFSKSTKVPPILSGFLIGILSGILHHLSVIIDPGGLGFLWMNPLYNLLPAVMWGLTIGFLFHLVKNKKSFKIYSKGKIHIYLNWYLVLGIMSSLVNTLYVVGLINIFRPVGYQFFTAMILVTNALPEAVIGGIITFTFSKSMQYLRF